MSEDTEASPRGIQPEDLNTIERAAGLRGSGDAAHRAAMARGVLALRKDVMALQGATDPAGDAHPAWFTAWRKNANESLEAFDARLTALEEALGGTSDSDDGAEPGKASKTAAKKKG